MTIWASTSENNQEAKRVSRIPKRRGLEFGTRVANTLLKSRAAGPKPGNIKNHFDIVVG